VYVESFDIQPFVGALPIAFGMHRSEVHAILGSPEVLGSGRSTKGTSDSWLGSRITVRYNLEWTVVHVGFCLGEYELKLLGTVLWNPSAQPDPNPELLRLDPAPREVLGFLVFTRLGVTTTGYHDDDESQRALTIFPRGTWDLLLEKATEPDLVRYLTMMRA